MAGETRAPDKEQTILLSVSRQNLRKRKKKFFFPYSVSDEVEHHVVERSPVHVYVVEKFPQRYALTC